jgi:hypothetical protein
MPPERQPNIDEARAALANAERFTRAGQNRGRWPAWAAAIDAVGCGALIVAIVYLAAGLGAPLGIGAYGISPWLVLLVASAPIIAFRYWWRARSGVTPGITALDLWAGVAGFAGAAAAVATVNVFGVIWPAWIVGIAYGAGLYLRRRRRILCPVVDRNV